MPVEPHDEELMLAVRDGDLDRLALLFDRYHARLFDFFRRMGATRAESEDSVQDVFLRILRYRSTFHDGSPFAPWLYRIARNVRMRQHKGEGPRSVTDTAIGTNGLPDDSRRSPAQTLEQAEEAAAMQRALLKLSVDSRELLVLVWYQGLSFGEIAALLDIDPGAARVRAHRAIKALRGIYLKEKGEKNICDVTNSKGASRII